MLSNQSNKAQVYYESLLIQWQECQAQPLIDQQKQPKASYDC